MIGIDARAMVIHVVMGELLQERGSAKRIRKWKRSHWKEIVEKTCTYSGEHYGMSCGPYCYS